MKGLTALEPKVTTLVGDIGGTNSRFALANSKGILPKTVRRFANDDHLRLDDAVQAYLNGLDTAVSLDRCVLAVAGPVRNQSVRLTNRNWDITAARLGQITGSSTAVILNDLQAQGYALGRLGPSSFQQVRTGRSEPGPELVVGIGTGFNTSTIIPVGGSVEATVAESGHMILNLPTELCQQGTARAVSVEDLLSGRGLSQFYKRLHPDAPAMTGQEISKAILSERTEGFAQMGTIFAQLLGEVIANLALTHLPFAGVTFCGSVARALAPLLRRPSFEKGYLSSVTMAKILSPIPMRVLLDDAAALAGCAAYPAKDEQKTFA